MSKKQNKQVNRKQNRKADNKSNKKGKVADVPVTVTISLNNNGSVSLGTTMPASHDLPLLRGMVEQASDALRQYGLNQYEQIQAHDLAELRNKRRTDAKKWNQNEKARLHKAEKKHQDDK